MDEKKKQERRERLEARASETRQKAVALENAIQAGKRRKKMAELIKKYKAKEAEKERSFAQASNSDEAEGELPSLETQLGSTMSEQDILERGTLLQRARLYYSLRDFDGYFGSEQSDPDEAKAAVIASIKSKDDIEKLRQCEIEYTSLQRYGQRLTYYFKRFQTNFGILAGLLLLWDNYDKEAARLTATYKRWKKRDPDVAQWFVELTLMANGENRWGGAGLRFDEEKGAFLADVEPEADERSLYTRIQKEATETTEALSDFKAYAMVVEAFLCDELPQKSLLHYKPISIQIGIENAEEERYTRYIIKNRSFFRSEINYRRSKGETITPEEERRAVIPDFYEVEPTPEVYENCIDGLLGYFENYNKQSKNSK